MKLNDKAYSLARKSHRIGELLNAIDAYGKQLERTRIPRSRFLGYMDPDDSFTKINLAGLLDNVRVWSKVTGIGDVDSIAIHPYQSKKKVGRIYNNSYNEYTDYTIG